MLDTLYQFGRQLSQNADREEFDDIIFVPPIDEKDVAKGVQFHVAFMVFDLDQGTFYPGERTIPYSFEDKSFDYSPYSLRCIKIQGGNNKSIYPVVSPVKSFDPWKKTLFGKEDKNGNPPNQAEFVEAINKDYPDLANALCVKAVANVFMMRDAFEAAYPDLKALSAAFEMDEKNRIAMLCASVKSDVLGIPEPTPVTQLDGFDDFLRRKLQKGGSSSSDATASSSLKRCYVTGELRDDVSEPEFSARYSLNKMFVTTTKNYASDFDDAGFGKNYQASAEAQVFLERGSAHVLKNYVIKIAGIDHCILPRFLTGHEIDMDAMTTRIKKGSELLFVMNAKQVGSQGLFNDLQQASGFDMYWLNFLGFESDGNFFKSINNIEDVSKTHLEQCAQYLDETELCMTIAAGDQWDSVMTYGKEQTRYYFNFQTIYGLISVRKEKEKKNAALALFKSILERRPVDVEKIYKHFVDLIQCHRFNRYAGSNIIPNTNFDYATRDAVFQYHALLLFLKKLNLSNMEQSTVTTAATIEEKNAAITTFFERMNYTDDQRAVFYLGRILNNVGWAQAGKGHASKPVLNKINFNGMDAAALKRLHADLFEKCKQYDILRYNEGNFSKFTDLFSGIDNKVWDKNMKPDESLFFLLAGYSFRTAKESSESEDITNAEKP